MPRVLNMYANHIFILHFLAVLGIIDFFSQCSTLPRQSCSCGWGLVDDELHQGGGAQGVHLNGGAPHLPSSLPPPLPPPPPLPDSSPGEDKKSELEEKRLNLTCTKNVLFLSQYLESIRIF